MFEEKLMQEKKIKVMHLTRSLNVGGLEKLVALFAKRIDPEIFDVSVCCILRKGFFAEELESQGIKIFLVNENVEKNHSRFLFFKLSKILKQEQPDILHTHNTHPLMDGTIAGLMAKTPVIIHTDHARAFPDKLKYMIAENVLSRFINKMVAVSEFSKQQLVDFEKINPDKITVIPNGVNFESKQYDVKEIRKEFGVDNYEIVIGTVSRLTEQKGTKYLIEAMPKVIEAIPGIVLMVVGDGVCREDLEQQVKQLGIENNVKFYGYQKAVDKYIQSMDFLVSSSIWEGMPLGILEVMQCGKPIVATTVGGVPEVVEHGKTGLLVESKQPEQLADAIVEMANKEGFIESAGLASIQRYKENFTEEIMLKRYEELYLQCLK